MGGALLPISGQASVSRDGGSGGGRLVGRTTNGSSSVEGGGRLGITLVRADAETDTGTTGMRAAVVSGFD